MSDNGRMRWARHDIITSVIDWMMANESAITEDLALRCECEARREWGGQRIDNVAKTPEIDQRARRQAQRAAHADLLTADARPVQDIATARGLSRAAVYRLMRRGPPVP